MNFLLVWKCLFSENKNEHWVLILRVKKIAMWSRYKIITHAMTRKVPSYC
jgi:hypothetical protein